MFDSIEKEYVVIFILLFVADCDQCYWFFVNGLNYHMELLSGIAVKIVLNFLSRGFGCPDIVNTYFAHLCFIRTNFIGTKRLKMVQKEKKLRTATSFKIGLNLKPGPCKKYVAPKIEIIDLSSPHFTHQKVTNSDGEN